MVRRVDRNGEAFFWCRKCSGYARQRLGPKLMIQYKLEKMGTQEYGKMSKRILTLEEGRSRPRMREDGKLERRKRRVTRKECKRVREEFEVGGFMAQHGWWNITKKRMLEDSGRAWP